MLTPNKQAGAPPCAPVPARAGMVSVCLGLGRLGSGGVRSLEPNINVISVISGGASEAVPETLPDR